MNFKKILSAALLLVSFSSYSGNVIYASEVDCKSEIVQNTSVFSNTYEKFAKHLDISVQKLEELLTVKKGENTFNLVPIINTTECQDHWLNIFVYAQHEYMKNYADGKLKSCQHILSRFNFCYRRVWGLDDNENQKPKGMSFIITYNNKFAGQITIGPLRDCSGVLPEIGYATLEEYSQKGVTSAGVELLINLLKYMKNENMYTFNKIRATSNVNNLASNKILKKCGFKLSPCTVMEFGMEQNEYILSI